MRHLVGNMVCKEEIAKWFKGLEGDERIDLMCSLLDSCLPLELRFLGTYIEFAASKHYGNLQKYEKTANESTFGELRDLYDATVRRKFCIYLALLYSYNRKVATELYKFLEHFEIKDEEIKTKGSKLSVNGVSCSEDETCLNEIKLLLSMASYHPAFTFQQKEVLRKKLVRKHFHLFAYILVMRNKFSKFVEKNNLKLCINPVIIEVLRPQ